MTARGAWARAGALAAAILVVDQITKLIVRHHVAVGSQDSVFPAVDIVHVKNRGVAFSAFENHVGIVIVLIAAAVAALLVYFARNATRSGIWVPTGMLLGGAIGNVIDRLAIGSVTDFIKLPAWPAFNVADMSITFGVLALLYVLERRPEGAPGAPDRAG